MTELEIQNKSFDYWIGNPQSKGTDVAPKDRPYFLDVLKSEHKELLKSNSDLRSKNRTLNDDKEMLKGKNGSLKEINSELIEENLKLTEENVELKTRIKKMTPYLDCDYCKNNGDEIVCPENEKRSVRCVEIKINGPLLIKEHLTE